MKRTLGLALIALLSVAPACQQKKEDVNLPEQIATKLEAADNLLRNMEHDLAAESYQWVLDNDPSNAKAHLGLGRVDFEKKNFDKAIPHLEKAAELAADDAQAHGWLGRAQAKTAKWAEAAASAAKAAELDEDHADAWNYDRGIALRESGSLEESEKVLREVSELNPRFKYVYRELAETIYRQKRLDDGLRMFMKAQSAWKGDQMSFIGAAKIYEEQGQVSKALDQYSQYIQQDCCSDYSTNEIAPKVKALKEKENAGITQEPPAGEAPPADG